VFPVKYGLQDTKTLHSAHTVYLCVPYDSHNKQRLFPQTALTGWSLLWRRSVFPVKHELQDTKTLHSVHTVYSCVPYGSHNKQRYRAGYRSVEVLH
jgi:hypothetical protein